MKNEEFLTKVSHRTFDKAFKPIRKQLIYFANKPFISRIADPWGELYTPNREPADDVVTLTFVHPLWKKMPIAKIQEVWTEKGIVKEYYVNEPFAAILKGENNAEARS